MALKRATFKRLKILLKVILLFLLVPSIFFYAFGLEALIYVLIYFQFLLLWAQVELGMRQHALTRFQSEPYFDVERSPGGALYGVGERGETIRTEVLKIKNISDWPAYNVMLARVLDDKFLPIEPSKWKKWLHTHLIRCLPPHKEEVLCSWIVGRVPKDFEKLIFEVHYRNRFGDYGVLSIMFFSGEHIILSQSEPPKPGWLLPTLEEFGLLLRLRQFKKLSKMPYKKK